MAGSSSPSEIAPSPRCQPPGDAHGVTRRWVILRPPYGIMRHMGTVSSPARAAAPTTALATVRGPLPAMLAALMLALPAYASEVQGQPEPAPAAATQPAPGAQPGAVRVALSACHDCPICTSSMPEVQRIADDYAARGVGVSVVLED